MLTRNGRSAHLRWLTDRPGMSGDAQGEKKRQAKTSVREVESPSLYFLYNIPEGKACTLGETYERYKEV